MCDDFGDQLFLLWNHVFQYKNSRLQLQGFTLVKKFDMEAKKIKRRTLSFDPKGLLLPFGGGQSKGHSESLSGQF